MCVCVCLYIQLSLCENHYTWAFVFACVCVCLSGVLWGRREAGRESGDSKVKRKGDIQDEIHMRLHSDTDRQADLRDERAERQRE